MTVRIHAENDGTTQDNDFQHGVWFLAEQDCDLDQTADDDQNKLFELRPIRTHSGDVPSAITGSRARIDDHRCLHAMDFAARVTAAWLTANVSFRSQIPAERRRQIKTWLGYRYDRPAVPDEFVPTHRRLAALAKVQRAGFDYAGLRDVLVTYEMRGDSGLIVANLHAIVERVTVVDGAQKWLARVRDAVGEDEPFLVDQVLVNGTDGFPISLLELGFSLYGDRHSLATAGP